MRFPSFPRASLAALAAYAVVVSAFPSLTAETQIPNANATGFKNLKATLPENTAADAAGSRPSFRGAKVSREPGSMIVPHANGFGLLF